MRRRTTGACAPLSVEDHQIQSMPDASPAKWHLAHTTWFFETFVLARLAQAPFDERYGFLFNSYYDGVGARHAREHRGLATRPSLADVTRYRDDVDRRIVDALAAGELDPTAAAVVELGLHHEQQHQELLLCDVKHAFATQPLQPRYRGDLAPATTDGVVPLRWCEFDPEVVEIGAGANGFAFDNERPRHRVVLHGFRFAKRPLCNAEVIAFIADGGYRDPRLWLADGFALATREGWSAPLYWQRRDDAWWTYTLGGVVEVAPAETACHLSYFEADAVARWAGARLPTEAEWERSAVGVRARDGHWADDDRLHPRAAGDGVAQVYGDVWEWTSSSYAPYPGFRPLPGPLAEYNAKFMSGQMVLRGGSCLTPLGHVRASYRNYFPPAARWQMAGVRLAKDRDR